MKLFVRDKSFYQQLAVITIPIALQNLINVGVSMADTMMVGALGETQLSGVSLANQLGFVLLLLSFGTGGGAGVLIAQFWGKREIQPIHMTITLMYRVMLAASLVFTVAAVFFPAAVMGVFSTDPGVIAEGAAFLRIVGAAYPLWSLTTVTLTMLRNVRSVNISVAVSLSAFVTNVFLNWVLIFGNLGAPALGVRGAAIATTVSRLVEFCIACTYLLFIEKNIRYKASAFFKGHVGKIAKSFADTAVPVALNELVWSLGAATIAVIIGRMGREFTAAQAIGNVLSQFVTIILFAMANASAVITGNTVGAGEYTKAKEYGITFLVLSAALGLASGGVVMVIKDLMLSMYSISDLARLYGDQVITIIAGITVFQSVNCTAIIGILRGGGSTRFALIVDAVFLWFVCIPLGFFTGLYLQWPVWAVYLILRIDEVLKVVACLPKIFRGNWINDLTVRH